MAQTRPRSRRRRNGAPAVSAFLSQRNSGRSSTGNAICSIARSGMATSRRCSARPPAWSPPGRHGRHGRGRWLVQALPRWSGKSSLRMAAWRRSCSKTAAMASRRSIATAGASSSTAWPKSVAWFRTTPDRPRQADLSRRHRRGCPPAKSIPSTPCRIPARARRGDCDLRQSAR